MTYPVLFRKKVLDTKAKENLSFVEVAKRFGLSKTTIFQWSKKLAPQTTRAKKPCKIADDVLKNDIQQYPDSYGYERAQRLGVSATGIRDAQYRLGVTYKKKPQSSQSNSRKKISVLPKN